MYHRLLGKLFSFVAIKGLRSKINEASKIFPHLETLKHGESTKLESSASCLKLCVRPYRNQENTSATKMVFRSWFNTRLEKHLDDCDLYFYDDVKGCVGKQTGYQLPFTVIENTIKLLGKFKRDEANDTNYDKAVDEDNCVYRAFGLHGKSKKNCISENNYNKKFKRKTSKIVNTLDSLECYNVLKDHLEKLDALAESRASILVLLDSISPKNNNNGDAG